MSNEAWDRRIGPDTPNNAMVICPHCTSQFVGMSLKDQAELYSLKVKLAAWYSTFETTQLTHAFARLEAAESKAEKLKAINAQLLEALKGLVEEMACFCSEVYRKPCDYCAAKAAIKAAGGEE